MLLDKLSLMLIRTQNFLTHEETGYIYDQKNPKD